MNYSEANDTFMVIIIIARRDSVQQERLDLSRTNQETTKKNVHTNERQSTAVL